MNIFSRLAFSGFLEEDERIVQAFRRPFFFLFVRVVLWGVLAGALSFLLWFFVPPIKGFHAWWVVAFLGVFKIVSEISFWYVNAVLMTTESILFIEWLKLFEKRNQRLDFSNLDAVSIEKKGVHSFCMNFGTLVFEKTGGGGAIQVDKINAPSRAVRIIENYKERKVDEKNFTEESALKDLLSQLVQTHVGVNGQPERPTEKTFNHNPSSMESESPKPRKKFFRKKKRHFESQVVEIEKTLDDDGGVEIDLTEGE